MIRATVATASPLTVRLAGSATTVPALRNPAYAPVVDDAVAVSFFADNGQPYVHGKAVA